MSGVSASADGGSNKVSVGASLVEYGVRAAGIAQELGLAYDAALQAAQLVGREDFYQGEAGPEMEAFFMSYCGHVEKLVVFYTAASQWAADAVGAMCEMDADLAAAIVAEVFGGGV